MIWVGQGWDIHRLGDGGPLRLAGIDVPFDRHLIGHSDGDVVLHAIADALLGAVAAGDIGEHFPDTDPALRGADSGELLKRVMQVIAARGANLVNADVTILAELRRVEGLLAQARGDLAAARAALEESRSILELRYGPDHWRTRRASAERARLGAP